MPFHRAPKIFDMLELCMSGHAFRIFRRSSFAHTMNAFMGRLMCGLLSLSLFGCCLIILAFSEFSSILKLSWPHTATEKIHY